MLKSFLCPSTPNDIVLPAIKEPDYKNLDEICVKITSDEQQKSVTLLDTKSSDVLTDEWLLDKEIDWKDTIEFVPPVEKGIVIKVYDGDTITIASKLPYLSSPLYRFSVRLNGIDCPEIKSKDENEKQCAQIAKKEMSDLILNKIVILNYYYSLNSSSIKSLERILFGSSNFRYSLNSFFG